MQVVTETSTSRSGRERVDALSGSKGQADKRRDRRDELQAAMVLFGAVFGWVLFVVAAIVAAAILIFG